MRTKYLMSRLNSRRCCWLAVAIVAASIEMAVLNVVHAQGEYWELWHGDGLSMETCAAVARAWEEGRRLGYEAYKDKLISEGQYRTRDEDDYPAKRRSRGHSAQASAD